LSGIRDARQDASNPIATRYLGGEDWQGGYARWPRLVNFGMGMTRTSERLAAVERCCQNTVNTGHQNRSVKLTCADLTHEWARGVIAR
jgi:hypothetical protein